MTSHHKTPENLKVELEQINAAKADPVRFSVLYDRYYRSIFIFIYRRTGNEDLTADITSVVFLKAIINIKKYEFKGVPFSAWLFRIALNEISMHFRKSKAERVISFDKGDINSIIDETTIDEDREELNKKLMHVLRALQPDQIQLIELRFFEKRSFAEMGSILGMNETNAKIKLYRLLDKIKAVLTKK